MGMQVLEAGCCNVKKVLYSLNLFTVRLLVRHYTQSAPRAESTSTMHSVIPLPAWAALTERKKSTLEVRRASADHPTAELTTD